MTKRITGVLSPVVTPFDRDLRPDAERLIAHSRWLLQNDVGLAVFGTNSEGNSLNVAEKIALLEQLTDAGLPAERMMPGTGTCALPDTIALSKRAVELGCGGVLMLPPFYYKGVSDEGLFRSYAQVIEGVGDDRLRIYLYHIPQVAQVSISLNLIERLLKEYPTIIAGIKDSSGNWENTKAMLDNYQPQGFDVFCGSETFLLDTKRAGGVGCISATANVNPAPIAKLDREWQQADADEQQQALNQVRSVFQNYTVIAALKGAIAHYSNDPSWLTVRPPLIELTSEQQSQLQQSLANINFQMPGLGS